MNRDREFSDDPLDGSRIDFDPRLAEAMEHRLRQMRPIEPEIDLEALMDMAQMPNPSNLMPSAADIRCAGPEMSAADRMPARSTRHVLTLAGTWLCGVAMGALAMFAVQRSAFSVVDATGTDQVQMEQRNDPSATPLRHEPDLPKSAAQLAADQGDRRRDLPTTVPTLRERDVPSTRGRTLPDDGRSGEMWRTGMLLRDGVDSLGIRSGGGPSTTAVVKDSQYDERNATPSALRSDAERPAPTRDRLLREMLRDRAEGVF
jgi:hypothetical protein